MFGVFNKLLFHGVSGSKLCVFWFKDTDLNLEPADSRSSEHARQVGGIENWGESGIKFEKMGLPSWTSG